MDLFSCPLRVSLTPLLSRGALGAAPAPGTGGEGFFSLFPSIFPLRASPSDPCVKRGNPLHTAGFSFKEITLCHTQPGFPLMWQRRRGSSVPTSRRGVLSSPAIRSVPGRAGGAEPCPSVHPRFSVCPERLQSQGMGEGREKTAPGTSSESSPAHTSGSYISKLISHIEAV